ncbi:UDP-xylose transporter [Vigna angularis]|uniref:UDP-xylose transporter n=1 Tax=Phaseolus angularis TaxID=3914 RepID=A0A8T0KJK8_PHAAN|nr:UDP-xylose transporter [Vigna angularis]
MVMGFGILNGISIGLLNLSLGFNSVGFYQMTKLAIIPCTILLEILFLGKKFSKRIQFSLVILLVGVGIATITDLQLNALGAFLSLLAIITTCVAQIIVIILSCLISIAVNFSTFLVIGKTSPVTYQVLGHLKTCLVLAFGYIIVHDPFSWRNILGIMVAMVGMIIYSYCCVLESQQKPVEGGGQVSQARDNETETLINVENSSAILNKRPPVWNKDKDKN